LYNSNVEDITAEAQVTGGGPNTSYAFTINGLTSGLLNCTEDGMLASLTTAKNDYFTHKYTISKFNF